MRCYKCGRPLTDEDHCPNCGANVVIYKQAAKASNAYYNLGLAKAEVRDLTGAIESLKTSLMIDKTNIPARNLLGLVYCEMGDVVEALSQWVISRNMKPEDNAASEYITTIQENQARFEAVTGTIKKYNLSLKYTHEGNIDMARIQLKKVVSQNPRLLRAQQLLALLYLKDGEFNKARRCLNSVLKVDRNNTLAQRYMKDIEEELREKQKKTGFIQKRRELENTPLSGNDVIIPRSSYRMPSNGAVTVVNVLIGILIGAAMIYFLILPAKYKGMTQEYNSSISSYSEQLSDGDSQLTSLESQLKEVQKEKDELEAQVTSLNGSGGSNKLLTSLISAANYYVANNKVKTAENLADIDDVSALTTDDAKALYNTLAAATMASSAKDIYNEGMTDYEKKSYSTAAAYFVKAYKCDSTYADAVYYAAKSYDAANDSTNAKKYYNIIVSDFKTSSYYTEANTYVSSH